MRALIVAALTAALATPAAAHEWYQGLHGKDGQLCCGADDCEPTVFEERRGEFYFYTREKHWLRVPSERITFLPVPGDESDPNPHRAHLCYRGAFPFDVENHPENVFTDDAGNKLLFFCGFIPPGAI